MTLSKGESYSVSHASQLQGSRESSKEEAIFLDLEEVGTSSFQEALQTS